MKLSKRQINAIVESTPQALKGGHASFESDFGYFMPCNANWSYQAGYVRYNGNLVLVVKVFGAIR
ncbi:MAG: hypothetical protein FWC00_03435 [Firmicutes bacterium]|nr:hypothetical protein [Bacillota bacterium]